MEREMNVKQGFVYKENKLESRNKWRYELKTQNKVSCRRELFQKCWWYMPFSNFQSSAWVIFLYLFILVLNFTHLWSFHTAYELSFKILWAFTSQTRHLLQNVMFFFPPLYQYWATVFVLLQKQTKVSRRARGLSMQKYMRKLYFQTKMQYLHINTNILFTWTYSILYTYIYIYTHTYRAELNVYMYNLLI